MAKKGVTRVAKGLMDYAGDMSTAARMRRAAEQGWNTDRRLYHGTKSDIDSFMPGGFSSSDTSGHGTGAMGVWLSDDPHIPNTFAGTTSFSRNGQDMAPNVLPVYTRAKNPKVYDIDPEYAQLKREYDVLEARLSSPEFFEARDAATAQLIDDFHGNKGEFADMEWKDAADLFRKRWDEAESAVTSGLTEERNAVLRKIHRLENEGRGLDPFRQFMRDIGYEPGRGFSGGRRPEEVADELWEQGYDSVEIRNTGFDAPEGEVRNQTLILSPMDIRSVNAAFDPAKADSSDILASINLAPYAVAGAGAYSALSPEEAEASEDIDIEKSIRVGDFVRRRAQKNAYWEGVKALGGLGSMAIGGTVAGLSTIPGYLNPLQSNEATEAGADWVADKLTYIPEDNAYMQSIGEILNSAMPHLQPYADRFERAWPHSLPGKVWNSLPESTRGLLLGASEVL